MRDFDYKKIVKNNRKLQHENSYGKPMCHMCDKCYHDKSKKHDGYTYYCTLTGKDVGQSHFGMNSPRSCPLRDVESNTQIRM